MILTSGIVMLSGCMGGQIAPGQVPPYEALRIVRNPPKSGAPGTDPTNPFPGGGTIPPGGGGTTPSLRVDAAVYFGLYDSSQYIVFYGAFSSQGNTVSVQCSQGQTQYLITTWDSKTQINIAIDDSSESRLCRFGFAAKGQSSARAVWSDWVTLQGTSTSNVDLSKGQPTPPASLEVTGMTYRGAYAGSVYVELYGNFADYGNQVLVNCNGGPSGQVQIPAGGESAQQINLSLSSSTATRACQFKVRAGSAESAWSKYFELPSS